MEWRKGAKMDKTQPSEPRRDREGATLPNSSPHLQFLHLHLHLGISTTLHYWFQLCSIVRAFSFKLFGVLPPEKVLGQIFGL